MVVLIIFPVILQTVINVIMLSIGGQQSNISQNHTNYGLPSLLCQSVASWNKLLIDIDFSYLAVFLVFVCVCYYLSLTKI